MFKSKKLSWEDIRNYKEKSKRYYKGTDLFVNYIMRKRVERTSKELNEKSK